MDTQSIVSAIDAEIAKLQQAKAILSSMPSMTEKRGPGRPKGTAAPTPTREKRVLSAEARARIVAAQKKRWAAKSGQK